MYSLAEAAPAEEETTVQERNRSLLRELNHRLHEMSQPVTVLLCTLEYGGSLDSVAEMKEMIGVSQEACERLRKTVAAMQRVVKDAIEAARQGVKVPNVSLGEENRIVTTGSTVLETRSL